MSKIIVVKISGTVHFSVEDLQSDVADDIRQMCDLDPFEAVEDEHIEMYIKEQDIHELVQEFGLDDADILEVVVK
jgi:hypothetical protein